VALKRLCDEVVPHEKFLTLVVYRRIQAGRNGFDGRALDYRPKWLDAMAHYFIDLRDTDGMVRDEAGSSFSSLEDALDEAKASSRDLAKQYTDNCLPLTEACVEVRDMQGRTVAVLTIAEVLEHPVHPAFKTRCSDRPIPGHR